MKKFLTVLPLIVAFFSLSSHAYYHCHVEYQRECTTETTYKRHCRKVKDSSDDGYKCVWEQRQVHKTVCKDVPRQFCHDVEGCRWSSPSFVDELDQDQLEQE